MRKILFVCHGNICRSQMAQSIASYLAEKEGKSDLFYFDSAATSTEEIGSTMYPPAVRKLQRETIPVIKHRARQITKRDLEEFDEIYYMDENNRRNLEWMFRGEELNNVFPLSDKAIADPWYTDDFDTCFNDIIKALYLVLNLE